MAAVILDPLNDGKSKLELIDHMGNDLSVVNDARASFEKESETLTERDEKLIRYLIKHQHTSPFRGVVFKFKVKAPLFCCRQWWKHVMASNHNDEQMGWNEKCISGTQEVKLWHGRKSTVKQLFDLAQKDKSKLPYVRSVNEKGEIVKNKIADVWWSGHRTVYRVTSELGFEIVTTDNHRFLTPDGYKELSDLNAGDSVMMNGIPAYQSKDWLTQKYVEEGLFIEDIANQAGCSYHTIRAWVRKHGIKVPRKEISRRSIAKHGVFGKGETKETNPKLAERASKVKAALSGKPAYARGSNHHAYKGENITNNAGHWRGRKAIEKRSCSICDGQEKLEVHHKDGDPKNNDPSNLVVVCQKHHQMYHGKHVLLAAHPVKIAKIEELPPEDVYDIQMLNESNLVVSQFVVHNSFRYVPIDDSDDFYVPAIFRAQSSDNKQATEGSIPPHAANQAYQIYRVQCRHSFEAYQQLLALGVGREQARGVLVPSVYTSWVWTASLQAALHFIGLRKGHGAQLEIGAYALGCLDLIAPIVPVTIAAWEELGGF
jgi:thymidylate synthase ThyX